MQCPIKEVLPSKIYKAQGETKNGLEYYISNEGKISNSHETLGTFSHYFTEILIKKEKSSFDRVEISPPMDGLLSLTVQYPSRGSNLQIKLVDAWSYATSL